MLHATLHALERDVRRLLWAGAGLASRDEALRKHTANLAPVAEKVPALGRVLSLLRSLEEAPPVQAAAELLSLAALLGQLCSAQAQAGLPGELSPVPSAPALKTPLAANEARALYGALLSPTKGAAPVLQSALSAGTIADLRVLAALLVALQNPSRAERLLEQDLPHGGALVAPLRRLFRKDGGAADKWRLLLLARLDPDTTREQFSEWLRTGSVAVREGLVQALPWLVSPEEAEALVLRLLSHERAQSVRAAAAASLSRSASPQAIEALLSLLGETAPVANLAFRSLRDSTSADLNARLLSILRAAFDAKRPSSEEEKTRDAARVPRVIELCGSRRVADALPYLLRCWREDLFSSAESAGSALVQLGHPEGLSVVAQGLESTKEKHWNQALDAILCGEPALAFAQLAPWFAPERLATAHGARLALSLLGRFTDGFSDGALSLETYTRHLHEEPRWLGALLRMVHEPKTRGELLISLDLLLPQFARQGEEIFDGLANCFSPAWLADKKLRVLALRALEAVFDDPEITISPRWEDHLLRVLTQRAAPLREFSYEVVTRLQKLRSPRLASTLLSVLRDVLLHSPRKNAEAALLVEWLEELAPEGLVAPLLDLLLLLPASLHKRVRALVESSATRRDRDILKDYRATLSRPEEMRWVDGLLASLSSGRRS